MDLTDGAVKTYRSWLEIIGGALASPPQHLIPRVPGLDSEVTAPHTTEMETALWAWSRGVRPLTRRQRVQGALVLGLGVGARRCDLGETRGRDVVRDDAGVHVTFAPTTRSGDQPRTVTCTQAWEDRLWHIAQTTRPDHVIVAPWRTHVTDMATFDRCLSEDALADAPTLLTPTRLRNTWLVRHLAAGTPLPILMQAAAIKTGKTLESLLTYVPEATSAQYSAALRQAR